MKKLLMLIVSASFVFVGMNTANARKQKCYANYCINNGAKCSGFKYLGYVKGFLRNKKKLCRNKAKSKAGVYFRGLVGTDARLCSRGIPGYIDTKVANRRNSKDVNMTIKAGNVGRKCVRVCKCPRGYANYRNAYCYRNVLASRCKLPAGVRTYAPYTVVRGYLYKRVTTRISCRTYVR